MSETIVPKELSYEEIKKLIEEAKNRPEEAKYILEIEVYTRDDIYDSLDVIYGEAEKINVYEDVRKGKVIKLIIPKTNPVIITKETKSRYYEYDGNVEIYIFTGSKGWVKVK